MFRSAKKQKSFSWNQSQKRSYLKNYQLDFVRSCRNRSERSRTTKAGVDECKNNRRKCLKLPKDQTPSRRWSKLKHHISRTTGPILFVSGAIESGDQVEQDVDSNMPKKAPAETRTPDLLHPKEESYH